MTGPDEATVTADQDGSRLDRVLSELFPIHSRNFLSKLITGGRVRIDGQAAVKPSQRVGEGQRVDLDLPEPAPSRLLPQAIPLTILHQDAEIVVIDKPAGLVVHPAAGHSDRTLVNALLFHVDDLSGLGGEIRPGIVHRLDKDTSGVMVVAKSDEAHRRLAAEWSSDRVRKEYLAVVYGAPASARGTIDAAIGRHPRDRKRMAVIPGGRRAVTEYEVVERYRYLSLVRCTLLTGRTHQIRVHLAHLGHPIVGDPVYSGPQWRGIPDKHVQRILSSFGRQALHAARISFPHPRTGEIVTFEAPVPEDMRGLIESVGG